MLIEEAPLLSCQKAGDLAKECQAAVGIAVEHFPERVFGEGENLRRHYGLQGDRHDPIGPGKSDQVAGKMKREDLRFAVLPLAIGGECTFDNGKNLPPHLAFAGKDLIARKALRLAAFTKKSDVSQQLACRGFGGRATLP
jgi:hypothetical protein